MRWHEARQEFPSTWLLVEAINAGSAGNRREVDELAFLGAYQDSGLALRRYLDLHRQEPKREFYVLHTSREFLEIEERRWVGARTA